MNREEAIYYLKASGMSDEQIKSVIDAFTCDDCISRAKALEMLGDEPENWTDTEKEIQEVNDYRWFKFILEELPPITSQQKIGKWIDVDSLDGALWHACSECGETEFYATDYCPNCGCRMKGEDE
jgi:hypothetical protein